MCVHARVRWPSCVLCVRPSYNKRRMCGDAAASIRAYKIYLSGRWRALRTATLLDWQLLVRVDGTDGVRRKMPNARR